MSISALIMVNVKTNLKQRECKGLVGFIWLRAGINTIIYFQVSQMTVNFVIT